MDDIALLRFDRSLPQEKMSQNSTESAIFPICLPDSSYNEINKRSMDQNPQRKISLLSQVMSLVGAQNHKIRAELMEKAQKSIQGVHLGQYI